MLEIMVETAKVKKKPMLEIMVQTAKVKKKPMEESMVDRQLLTFLETNGCLKHCGLHQCERQSQPA